MEPDELGREFVYVLLRGADNAVSGVVVSEVTANLWKSCDPGDEAFRRSVAKVQVGVIRADGKEWC